MIQNSPKTSHNLLKFSVFFEKSFRLIAKKIILLFLLTLFTATIYGQESGTGSTLTNLVQPQRIMHIDQFIASLRTASRNINSSPLRVESLIKDIQPSIYVLSTDANTYGDNPVCLFTDAKLLNFANFLNLSSNDIEIVTIKINDNKDLNSIIDLSIFSNFPKLKYIYILSTVRSTEDDIIKLVKNNNPKYNVFYSVLKTS